MLFWNGNKSPVRQRYESELLQAILDASSPVYGPLVLSEDRTDYPQAEDEADIFNKGADVTVTVAGNPKFADRDKLVIDQPIAKGVLGQRVLIIREADQDDFAGIHEEAELKAKVSGIPDTWADVAIFEANGYAVTERGTFEDIFQRLRQGQFDYVALGAFEVKDVFQSMARRVGGLAIENSLMLQYPMPLVFYVHPEREELAHRIIAGLTTIQRNGVLDALFTSHFGKVLQDLSLDRRTVFQLLNPLIS
ncbi:MAG: hypothetical protein AB3N64_00140 [Puniceicoccaceae bacterium]